MIRTIQLPPLGVPHVWSDASEPQQRKVEIWAGKLPRNLPKVATSTSFWVHLHVVNLRHGTDGFNFPPKEGALRTVSPENSDGFGRVWTRELGYQRPARSPLDHRSRLSAYLEKNIHSEATDRYSGFFFTTFLFSLNPTLSWRVIPSDSLSNMFLYTVKTLFMFSLILYWISSLFILISNKKHYIIIIIIIIILLLFINCNLVVTRWHWLFYM